MKITIEEDLFGVLDRVGPSGKPVRDMVRRFTLSNQQGVSVQVINYGSTITSIKTPDRNGKIDDVILGCQKIEDYVKQPYYFGSTIGRCSNRIAEGRLVIGDVDYQLGLNDGGINHLHGGVKGFDKVLWDSHVEGNSVSFSHLSAALDEGYPGKVATRVKYRLTDSNELRINMRATTTQLTPIDMCNHSYFNLGGHGSGPIYEHEISIYADHYLPKTTRNIPTGDVLPVNGTDFDLRSTKALGDFSKMPGGGFDHYFCLRDGSEGNLRPVATLKHPQSGRKMDLYSNKPGVQFYTGNFLPADDSFGGKSGAVYRRHGGLCLETHGYPNSVNQNTFPSVLVDSGEIYSQEIVYKFGIME